MPIKVDPGELVPVRVDPSELVPAGGSPNPAPSASRSESFGRGAAQGATLGWGDEIQGAVQALMPRPGHDFDPSSYLSEMGKRYRSERDAARADDARARAAHGGYYAGGGMVGGLAPAVLAGGAPGGIIGQGAALGAASGAGESTDNILSDTAKGAAIGGTVGAVTKGAAAMLPRAAHAIGNKFLNNTRGRISAKNNLSEAATTAAYEAGAIRPWRGIKGAAETLEGASDAAGDRVGAAIGDIGRTTGATTDAVALSQQLAQIGRDLKANSLNPAEYQPYFWAAQEVLVKGKGGKIPLDVAEAIKSSVYRRAKPAYGTVQGADVPATPGAWRDIGSRIRRANEKAAEAVASPSQMQEFLSAKEAYGPLRDAFRAAGEGAARAGNRSFLGMPEAMMLAAEGVGPTAGLKLARMVLPQTLGYMAWRGGQAASAPATKVLARALAAEAAQRTAGDE